MEDQRQLFEINYWGVVEGSLIAARHLRERGGAIINVGSVLSERAMVLQTAYSASKHAVKGFTDSLRSELIHDRSAIRLTEVHLPAIDTPQFDWARSHAEGDRRDALAGRRDEEVVDVRDRDVPAARGQPLHLDDRCRRHLHGHPEALGREQAVSEGDLERRVPDERDDPDRRRGLRGRA